MVQRECNYYVMGVDEAGRGPVIGPMIVAGVVMRKCDVERLGAIGVDDSKALSRSARERLAKAIEDIAAMIVRVEVPPGLIDEENLNVIERNTIGFIIGRGLDVFNDRLREVYIDAVGSPSSIVYVIRRVGFRGRVVAEPKADARYAIVGAASIIAKVYRDRVIDELRERYGVRGSGYPTDPETIAWLREAYSRSPRNPPWFVRRSWRNLRSVAPGWYRAKSVKRSGQRSLLDYL